MGEVKTHESGLVWYESLGMGHLPAEADGRYGDDYWEKYQAYKSSPIAEALMRARAALVERHAPGATLVDIGIGNGQFIEVRGAAGLPTYGYDVNPQAILWLVGHRLWWDPWARDPEAAAFWDSIEHLPRPEDLLARVRRWAFVSLPVFRDLPHVLSSKHFKPGEHLFYWTRRGFVDWAYARGFDVAEENEMETELGREGIGTFALRRRRPCP